MMNKEELLNSVEMLLSTDIIDAQTYTNLVRKVSLFNDSSSDHETPKVGNNEQTKEVCVICGYEISFGDAIAGACGNCNWQLD